MKKRAPRAQRPPKLKLPKFRVGQWVRLAADALDAHAADLAGWRPTTPEEQALFEDEQVKVWGRQMLGVRGSGSVPVQMHPDRVYVVVRARATGGCTAGRSTSCELQDLLTGETLFCERRALVAA